MTVVLVHGNPEVDAIWTDVTTELVGAHGFDRDDIICLSPPGFGSPVPESFGGTVDEYARWLIAELEQIDGPIDLIGHDWGGGHVIRAALLRPDLLRSVTTDIAGCFADGYQWHDAAQVWRTPGDGEAAIELMVALPVEDRTQMYLDLGMTAAAAEACAIAATEIGPNILPLYRSADEEIMLDLGNRYAALAERPSTHVIIATNDGYTGGEALARATATAWGARVHVLPGLGHWWMMEDPDAAAKTVVQIVSATSSDA